MLAIKSLILGAALVLLTLPPPAYPALPLGMARFNNSLASGNITFTPTNGFGTYVFGRLENVTCNNTTPILGIVIPQNPLVGNNSVPCRVAVTLNNIANATMPAQMQYMQNWDEILGSIPALGGTPIGENVNPNQCGGVGPVLNPSNNMTNIPGFLGNFPVVNGTVIFAGGPYNISAVPDDLGNKTVVIWRQPIQNLLTLWLNSIPLPSQMLSCANVRMA